MKNYKLITFTLLVFFNSYTYASGYNINVEDDKMTVKRSACINADGIVTDNDKRYFMCEGGKYDGFVTQGPAMNCGEKIDQTKTLIKENGLPDNANEFLTSAFDALSACQSKAQDKGWPAVKKSLDTTKKACDEYADQMSVAYVGLCLLKAAEIGQLIMGGR